MTLLSLTKLIKSLSGSEKRNFKIHTKMQSGGKDYIELFDLIDKSPTTNTVLIKEKFKQLNPHSSINNTVRYLVKILTDSLIQPKTEKDNFFRLLQEIMRVKVLQERSLHEEGYQLLKKIRRSANLSQHYLIEYLTYREELNHLAESNFQVLNDQSLVDTQMLAKQVLKKINNIQDHHSLFEVLKFRMVHSGKISSNQDKKKLNDLMLSEMVLLAGNSKNSFAAQKLHLLFQSYFFTHSGDYQSALKIFHSLNKLFEQNPDLLEKPPLEYYSALNGLLESLHSLKYFEEISYYVKKLSQLDKPEYPEYFRYLVRKTCAIYEFAILAGENKFLAALEYLRNLDPSILKMYTTVDEEKQLELYFFHCLIYFKNNDLKKAHSYIREINLHHKLQAQFLICKAIRLLNIIIHYQKGDTNYLGYEIRGYKRFFKEQNLLSSEKLLLKFIKSWPNEKRKRIPESDSLKLIKEIDSLTQDKFERQLLKYFDFLAWVSEKFTT